MRPTPKTDKRIRVLFVVPDLRYGGAERHVATLLPRMDPQKFIPSVVCIGGEGELFAEVKAAGVDATALFCGNKRHAPSALRGLISHMRRARPDVVAVWGYNAEILGRIAARVAGARCTVVWVHAAAGGETRSVVRRLADWILMRLTGTHYFGVAEAQRSFIIEQLGCPAEKVHIIHNGVDPGQFDVEGDRSALADFGVDASNSVVGIVAALRVEKDHATLLRAAKTLLTDLPHTSILIVGDGPLREELENLCGDLGISQNVHFLGSRGDVARLLRTMDVVVLCSTTECFPMSVLEAMACARPVVCTDVGGVREMIQDGVTGYLVPARAPGQLAARLKDVLSDARVARRMGEAGRRRIENEFTLNESVSATERALYEIANGKERRRGES